MRTSEPRRGAAMEIGKTSAKRGRGEYGYQEGRYVERRAGSEPEQAKRLHAMIKKTVASPHRDVKGR